MRARRVLPRARSLQETRTQSSAREVSGYTQCTEASDDRRRLPCVGLSLGRSRYLMPRL